jgi:NDP-sugar pyrophosphorylase family protein
MATALVMAGGRSSRMRATHGPSHKALVPVLGVPLLERNLHALLRHHFFDIVVAIAADESSVAEFAESRGTDVVRACGAALETAIEPRPLGTIGAARAFGSRSEALLIVNVDNLTAIDLRALVDHHLASGAALTVASHLEPFAIPFGEVDVAGGRIVAYREKPVRRLQVSSGTYVLSPRACAAIAPDRSTGAPQLIAALIASGDKVAAYKHDAAWTDVNDAHGVAAAESIVADHPSAFETWWTGPRRDSPDVMVRSSHGIVAVRESDDPGERWSVFGATSLAAGAAAPIVTFDEIDRRGAEVVRHHVAIADPRAAFVAGPNAREISPDAIPADVRLDEVSVRALAWERRRR